VIDHLQRGRALLRRFLPKSSLAGAAPLDYWKERAGRLGVRSVVHVGHDEAGLAEVTERQKALLLPLLRERLRGDERWLLDLGCGPGRFTGDLARTIGGRALGLDPTAGLLALAPREAGSHYARACSEPLPLRDDSVDVVWICLVLGGVVDDAALARTAGEVQRVLRPGGLLFLVENTSQKPDGEYWRFHEVTAWQALFAPAPLEHLCDYQDQGERIAVLCARLP
jgi:SAM-dependent methyltransferase